VPGRDGRGPNGKGSGSGSGQGSGRQGGRGRMGGPAAAGLSGSCICPKCGFNETHQRGQLCNQKQCPKCGTIMIRK
jgi:hypothetical protein